MTRTKDFIADTLEYLSIDINSWIANLEMDYYDEFKLIDIKLYEPTVTYKALVIYEMVEKGDGNDS